MSQQPRFVLVPHNRSFFQKIRFGLASLQGIVTQLGEDAAKQHPAAVKAPRKKR